MDQRAQINLVCPRGAGFYVWQTGDSIQGVAQRNGVSAESILVANPGRDFTALQAGDEICMPAAVITGDNSGTTTPTPEPVERPFPTTPSTPPTSQPGVVITPIVGFSCPTGSTARTVQRGQTYADLLVDNNVSYQAMRQSNPALNPSRLIAGTRYCAPPSGARQACAYCNTYRIQDGDNLTSVAQRYNTSNGRLLMLNPQLLPTDFSVTGTLVCVP